MADVEPTPVPSGPAATGGTDPGAQFDPTTVPVAPAEPPAMKPVTVAAVKKALKKGSKFAHEQGGGELVRADLRMQDHEAELIALGIARYINSRPALLAGVTAGGDEYLQALVGTLMYGGRVWWERSEALRKDAEGEDQAAPAGGQSEGDAIAAAAVTTRVNGASFGEVDL